MILVKINDHLKTALKEAGKTTYGAAYGNESAGLDLYHAGDRDLSILPAINANQSEISTVIPTGLRVRIPKGYVGLVTERGSVSKSYLKVRAGVIDHGYEGEVFVNCINVNAHPVTVKAFDKIPFQLIVVPMMNSFTVVDEFEKAEFKRGENKLGSTDELTF